MENASHFFSKPKSWTRHKVWVGIFYLLLAEGIAKAQMGSPPPSPKISNYDTLLNSLPSLTAEAQTTRLFEFIQANPTHERAYLKLWERYLKTRNFAGARACFQQLESNPITHRNGLWLNAKLFARDTIASARQSAYEAFSRALRLESSPALVHDFIGFLYQTQNAESNDPPAYLTTEFSTSDRVLAAFFYYYQNSKYDRALAIAPRIPSPLKDDHLVLSVLSECYARAETSDKTLNFLQAKKICQRGLALAEAGNVWEAKARLLAWRGELAFMEDIYEHAQADYQAAFSLALQIDDLYVQQKALAGMGKVQYINGNLGASDSLYRKAIEPGELAEARLDLSTLYSNLAHLLYEKGKFNEALEKLQQGEVHARRARDGKSLVTLQIASARIYHDLAIPHLGKKYCLEAMTKAGELNFVKLYHRAEGLFAQILLSEKDYVRARELCDRHIKYLQQTRNDFEIHNYTALFADTYRATNDFQRASKFYDQAIAQAQAVGASDYVAWYQIEIAKIDIQLNRFDEALIKLKKVSPDSFGEQKEGLIHYYSNLGFVHQKRKELDSAVDAYGKAAAIINTTHERLKFDHFRIGYFGERAKVFQGLAECYFQSYRALGQQSDLDSLCKYLFLTKARSLTSLSKQTISILNDKESNSNAAKYRQAGETLQLRYRDWRQSQIADSAAQEILEKARFELIVRRLQLFERDTSTSKRHSIPPTLMELQAWLSQNNSAMLLYHVSEEETFVFALTGQHAYPVSLSLRRQEMTQMVNSLLQPFHASNLTDAKKLVFNAELAYQLYQNLIAPVQGGLNSVERLIIVPDGILTSLPFEMLLFAPAQQRSYLPTDFPTYASSFLFNRYAIVYCPNMNVLHRSSNFMNQSAKTLIFANPFSASDGARWSYEPLPHSEIEAQRICEINSKSALFTREMATEQVFMREASQSRIIHFASHAFIDSSFYEFSTLVLAASDSVRDDGLLMGYEIERIQLPVELVSLSACKTGLGKIAEGEGVLGLPRLFLRAGAKSVLMTLWEADDQFAGELIPRFYELYLKRGLAKVEALAAAKRDLMLNPTSVNGIYHQHPFYWAAFTLYGDPGQNETPVITFKRALLIFAFVFGLLTLLSYLRFRTIKHAKARA